MTYGHRTWLDLEHTKAAGHDAYLEGLTPADVPYNEYDGLVRDWWLAGWRDAKSEDQQHLA